MPPETVVFIPVLNCGEMVPDDAAQVPAAGDWHSAVLESSTDLIEKGYVPVVVGGDGAATLPILEAYRRVHTNEEVVVMRFSAHADLGDLDGPLRTITDKKLAKGILSLGNRCVDFTSRRVRKAHKLMYVDQQGLFSKGYSNVRDLRNEYPVLLSFDFSVIDPAFIPGVVRGESGGFSVREALHMLHAVRGPKIIGVDFHGYSPELDVVRQDGLPVSTFATSKLIKEALVKVYSMSAMTLSETSERMQMMQAQGQISNSPYPDF
jgi:arginase family enzyme